MKLASNIAKNILHSFECEPDKMIHHIMKEGYQVPIDPCLAKDIICSVCGSNKGFYIPHLKTWSCLNLCGSKRCGIDHPKCTIPITELEYKKNYALDGSNKDKLLNDSFKSYAENPKGFMVFSGKNGTGKSWIANAILQDCPFESDDKAFWNVKDLNDQWLLDFEKWHSTKVLQDNLSDYKLLVLDDLGTRNPSEAFMDFLYSIVDKRWKNKLPTIITTNLNSTDLRSKFGDAFFSRACSGRNIRFEGQDQRIQSF